MHSYTYSDFVDTQALMGKHAGRLARTNAHHGVDSCCLRGFADAVFLGLS